LVEVGYKKNMGRIKDSKKWFKKVIAHCLLPTDTIADAFCDLSEEMHLTLLDEYEN
jgi:hypothetical protein